MHNNMWRLKPHTRAIITWCIGFHACAEKIFETNRSIVWYGVDGSWFTCGKIVITINRCCSTFFISFHFGRMNIHIKRIYSHMCVKWSLHNVHRCIWRLIYIDAVQHKSWQFWASMCVDSLWWYWHETHTKFGLIPLVQLNTCYLFNFYLFIY